LLNDSFFRIKREKEDNELSQADYIGTLEKREKERGLTLLTLEKDLKKERMQTEKLKEKLTSVIQESEDRYKCLI
jgi:hypothetical protein